MSELKMEIAWCGLGNDRICPQSATTEKVEFPASQNIHDRAEFA